MKRIPLPPTRNKRKQKTLTPYVIKYRHPDCVGWCVGFTQLDVELVDRALVVLDAYDCARGVDDRDLAQHLHVTLGMDELTARRLVRVAGRFYVEERARAQIFSGLEPPDGGAA